MEDLKLKLQHKPLDVYEYKPVNINLGLSNEDHTDMLASDEVETATKNRMSGLNGLTIVDKRGEVPLDRAELIAELRRQMVTKHIPGVIGRDVADATPTEIKLKHDLLKELVPKQKTVRDIKLKDADMPVFDNTEKTEEPEVEADKETATIVLKPVVEEEEATAEATTMEEEATTMDIKPKTKTKGIAELGNEILVKIGDTRIRDRIPRKAPQVNIHVDAYYMNNRERFINFINSVFEPYKEALKRDLESVNCDNIGRMGDVSLLTHQAIVRDYMNLYTPYHGVLLYHGLGAGKTGTSISIAEGMKSSKRVIVMTPASLRRNYIEELKKFGEGLYHKNQFWEWVSLDRGDVAGGAHYRQELLRTLSAVLNLPMEYISRKRGAWLINVKKPANFAELTADEKKSIDEQLDTMIQTKYTFINYNGLRFSQLKRMTDDFTKNIFDDAVVIIDEAHNLVSRIVNKIKLDPFFVSSSPAGGKKGGPNGGPERGAPKFVATKIYEDLLKASGSRIVLISGTPVINYPNEFGIMFNILRGYIKTWTMQLVVKTSGKVNADTLRSILQSEKTLDYLDYSASSKTLTITRNPFGFSNVRNGETGKYEGVAATAAMTAIMDDGQFERTVVRLLHDAGVDVVPQSIRVTNFKALPDGFEEFNERFINPNTAELINTDALKRRIVGLASYFRSTNEKLLPKFTNTIGVDYHVVNVPMSDFQFGIYEKARGEERAAEKRNKTKKKKMADAGKDLAELYEPTSTYRIFSRLFCNYVLPNRPIISEDERIERARNKKNKLQQTGGDDDDATSSSSDDEIELSDSEIPGLGERSDKTKLSATALGFNLPSKTRTPKRVMFNSETEFKSKTETPNSELFNSPVVDESTQSLKLNDGNKTSNNTLWGSLPKMPSDNLNDIDEDELPDKTTKTVFASDSASDTLEDLDKIEQTPLSKTPLTSSLRRAKKVILTADAAAAEPPWETPIVQENNPLKANAQQDEEPEEEVEGDDELAKMGGQQYKEQLQAALRDIKQHPDKYVSATALRTYSPKFLAILDNIRSPENEGLHLVYSQFRTLEGIGIFSLVLEANGFCQFRLTRNEATGQWRFNVDEVREHVGRAYALYTGTETAEEKEIVRNIYNGDWEYVPTNIAGQLRELADDNKMGEIIKVFMITASGSEGINLRNTRYVHLMEPYWHPVRLEQVIGRARRICSHRGLPEELQTVEVFLYLMVFTREQLGSDKSIELRLHDKGPINPEGGAVTSDQYLFEISQLKQGITGQLTDMIKETAFDCYIYGQAKCMNFTNPGVDDFAYVPDYRKQESAEVVQMNKRREEWSAVKINIGGREYAGRAVGEGRYEIYDLRSYQMGNPVQVGLLEAKRADGKMVFHAVVR